MKRITLLIALMLFLLTGCSDPPVASVHIDDPKLYLQTNNYVSNELNSSFVGILPTQLFTEQEQSVYNYEYQCSFMGDPNFLVYCSVYYDTQRFTQEINRLEQMDISIFPVNEFEKLYYVQPDINHLMLYTDNVINDGLSFRFEMALVDSENHRIDYLVARQQDNYDKSPLILEMIKKIQ